MAALVLLSLSVGAGGVVAAEHVLSAEQRAAQQRQREILQRRTMIEQEMVASRLERAELRLEEVRLLVERRMISPKQYDQARALRGDARRELERLTFDLDEIESTGLAPRNDLVAPRIHGRDFVAERLQLELRGLGQHLEALERRHEHTALLAQQGFVSDLELFDSQAEIDQARADLSLLGTKLELRDRWLSGLIPDEQVELAVMRVELTTRLESQQTSVERLQRRIARTRELVESKLASRGSVLELEAELTEARGMLELYGLELEVVRNRLSSDPR